MGWAVKYGLTLITAPTAEPLGLDETKRHLRLTANDFDAEITTLITAARQSAETETRRALLTQTWDLYRDNWPRGAEPIKLPFGQLQSVTSVNYTDENGSAQAWGTSNYIVSTNREPALIGLAYNVTWPTIRYVADTIRIRFVAGWTAAASVPAPIRQAMLLMIGHWFEQKTAVNVGNIVNEMPLGAKHLLGQYTLGDEWALYGAAC